jgi:protein ImuB
MNTLVAVAREFSPRYEQHRDDLVSIDVSGLDRLIGPPRIIGEELRRDAAARGVHVHVALASSRAAALVLALARPGLTVVDPGEERESLAAVPIAILEKAGGSGLGAPGSWRTQSPKPGALSLESLCRRWGLRTLGELAALPPADLSSRLGQQALAWQAIARGEDTAPLVPTLPEERFESSLELEWPVEGLEPMSFVLTRLLEPLSTRLERRDRGAAVLHLELRLVTHATSLGAGAVTTDRYDRHLQLPSPIRDVRTLRTLLLLDLESHPPPAAVDRVAILIDPTPGRVVQHTLFTRAHPTPEQLSTLLARLGALMGQDRIGAPATVDSHRPGAFRMEPFATEHDVHDVHDDQRRTRGTRGKCDLQNSASSAVSALNVVSALRRCRQPVPARAVIEDGRPTRLTTDRRGFAGGRVLTAAGPWRTSGNWWAGQSAVTSRPSAVNSHQSAAAAILPTADGLPTADCRLPTVPWNRDEWDVALADGAVYRVFRDRETDGWFIEAIVD